MVAFSGMTSRYLPSGNHNGPRPSATGSYGFPHSKINAILQQEIIYILLGVRQISELGVQKYINL